MAKKHWTQTAAGKKKMSAKIKAAWARKRAQVELRKTLVPTIAHPIQNDASNRYYSVYLTTFRGDKLLDVLNAVNANKLEIHILD